MVLHDIVWCCVHGVCVMMCLWCCMCMVQRGVVTSPLKWSRITLFYHTIASPTEVGKNHIVLRFHYLAHPSGRGPHCPTTFVWLLCNPCVVLVPGQDAALVHLAWPNASPDDWQGLENDCKCVPKDFGEAAMEAMSPFQGQAREKFIRGMMPEATTLSLAHLGAYNGVHCELKVGEVCCANAPKCWEPMARTKRIRL